MDKDFYIIFTEYCDAYYSNKHYGSWSESWDITPRNVLFGDYEDIKEYVYSTSSLNYEGIAFLDEAEPDFSEPFYIVYGNYSSGDSFGTADGKVEWIGITQDLNFRAALVKALNENKESFNVDFNYYGKKYSIPVPWGGYFDMLTNIEWDAIIVNKV